MADLPLSQHREEIGCHFHLARLKCLTISVNRKHKQTFWTDFCGQLMGSAACVENKYYGLNVVLSHSYAAANYQCVRRWGPGQCLVHQPHDGFMSLKKETLERSWYTWAHSKVPSMNQEENSLNSELAMPWSWISKPPELWEVNFCCL